MRPEWLSVRPKKIENQTTFGWNHGWSHLFEQNYYFGFTLPILIYPKNSVVLVLCLKQRTSGFLTMMMNKRTKKLSKSKKKKHVCCQPSHLHNLQTNKILVWRRGWFLFWDTFKNTMSARGKEPKKTVRDDLVARGKNSFMPTNIIDYEMVCAKVWLKSGDLGIWDCLWFPDCLSALCEDVLFSLLTHA